MQPRTGLLLRLVGMLIEFLCAAALLATRGRSQLIAGLVPMNYLFYGGLAVGLGMVIAGNILVRRIQPARRPPSDTPDQPASVEP